MSGSLKFSYAQLQTAAKQLEVEANQQPDSPQFKLPPKIPLGAFLENRLRQPTL